MTQFDTDYDDTDDSDDDGSSLVGNLRKQLKDANKRAKAAEDRASQNNAAARRVAFLDAGIPDSPQTKFFREHYDGELDAETIKSQAIANGFMVAEDHSGEEADLDLQSQTVGGGELPNRPGSMDEYQEAMRAAAEGAPRGQEAQAIARVHAKYARTLGES